MPLLAITRLAPHPGSSVFRFRRHHDAEVAGISEVTGKMFPFRTIPEPAVCFHTTPGFSAHVQLMELLLFQRRHFTVRAKDRNLRWGGPVALTTVTRDSVSLATLNQNQFICFANVRDSSAVCFSALSSDWKSLMPLKWNFFRRVTWLNSCRGCSQLQTLKSWPKNDILSWLVMELSYYDTCIGLYIGYIRRTAVTKHTGSSDHVHMLL